MIKGRTILLRFVFPASCACLGTWQIFRWNKKQLLLQDLEKSMNSVPKSVDSVQEIVPNFKFNLKLNSTGERVLLGPRGIPGISTGYGYTLFEKAQLSNGEIVVINRGNLKRGDENEKIENMSAEECLVLDKEEKRPLFAQSNTKNRILWKDWTVLKEAFNIPIEIPVKFLKIVVAQQDHPNPKNPLIAHQLTTQDIPNRHLEYIATWYTLGGLSILMSFLKK